VDLLRNGDDVTVDGDNGTIEMHNVRAVRCVSSVIYVNGKILMLRRPDDARSFPGVWSLVAGRVEADESTDDAAKREIFEETGLRVSAHSASLRPILVRENDMVWEVYPYIFVHDVSDVRLNKENIDHRWVLPGEMERMNTVASTISVVRELISKVIP
jgi:8-oxo-dGTP pyrophosphatase MutT (NUDIX family)